MKNKKDNQLLKGVILMSGKIFLGLLLCVKAFQEINNENLLIAFFYTLIAFLILITLNND
jgi:hypothetical protein